MQIARPAAAVVEVGKSIRQSAKVTWSSRVDPFEMVPVLFEREEWVNRG